jgi:hypothetical protein
MLSIMTKLYFNFFGVTAVIKSSDSYIIESFKFDFNLFIIPEIANPMVSLEATVCSPPWEIIPELVESMRSPEYVCFDHEQIRYVNYFGRALVRFDCTNETAHIYSNETDYMYEKLYLLLLSRTGELLDRKGLHRVHGLGIAVDNKAALFLMSSGGGKSTLALSLLSDPAIELISEDSPLLDYKGQLYPFPLRLGISKKQIPENAPPNLVRKFERERWGTKYLLHTDYFKDQIRSSPTETRWIFAGKWINSNKPQIIRISKFAIFMTLIRDCVFGLGIAQIIEFFLTSNPYDLFRKAGIAARRLWSVFQLTLRSNSYRILLSKDLAANSRLVTEFLKKSD